MNQIRQLKYRKSIKEYSLHNRYLGMTCKSKRISIRDRSIVNRMMMLTAITNGNDQNELADLLVNLILIHLSRIVERRIYRAPHARRSRTIRSFSNDDICNNFRFRDHEQLEALLIHLRIPLVRNVVCQTAGSICTGEELLLVGLYRICSVVKLESMEAIFGHDYTWISRVFDYFVVWMENNHGFRLFNNLQFWVPYMPLYAEKFRLKVIEKSQGQLNYNPGEFLVWAVVDCCNQVISRPGAGPDDDGIDANRRDPAGWMQRVFYNRYLGIMGRISIVYQYQHVFLLSSFFHIINYNKNIVFFRISIIIKS